MEEVWNPAGDITGTCTHLYRLLISANWVERKVKLDRQEGLHGRGRSEQQHSNKGTDRVFGALGETRRCLVLVRRMVRI